MGNSFLVMEHRSLIHRQPASLPDLVLLLSEYYQPAIYVDGLLNEWQHVLFSLVQYRINITSLL
jgi:hypothetical protein